MLLTRSLDRLDRLDDLDPPTTARGLGLLRIALGALLAVFPRAYGLFARADAVHPDTATALRLVGARDAVLGLGTLMAARRGPAAVRGWVEAGAVVDAADAVVLSGARGLKVLPRLLGTVVAGGFAALGFATARRLTD